METSKFSSTALLFEADLWDNSTVAQYTKGYQLPESPRKQ